MTHEYKVEIREWHGMTLVRVSDKPGFAKWLYGQTQPLVTEDEHPYDWAYYDDWARFIENKPIID